MALLLSDEFQLKVDLVLDALVLQHLLVSWAQGAPIP